MKRSSRTLLAVLIVAVLVGISSVAIAAIQGTDSISKESKALAFVNDKLSKAVNDSGQATLLSDNAAYENMLQTDLISAKTDDYVYLFDKDSGELKTIMLVGNKTGNTARLSSENAAIAVARAVVKSALPTVSTEIFDVKCRTTEQRYSIEFLEKLTDDMYGGHKISVVLDKSGTLETLVCVNNVAGAWKTNSSKAISCEKAIELAYAAINSWDNGSSSSSATADSETKTGTDVIVSDSGATSTDNAIAAANSTKASIERKSSHSITAYKEAKDDGILWQVDIANVDIGNGWTATYFVTLNALTGEVITVDMTR